MIRDEDVIYLDAVIPALKRMCDNVVMTHNGPTYEGTTYIMGLLDSKNGDSIVINEQGKVPDYGGMRQGMLERTSLGNWILKWDPDELPSESMSGGGLVALKDYIARHVPDTCTKVAVPIFHMVTETQCLSVEYGYAHQRCFLYQRGTYWKGNVHEQIVSDGLVHTIPIDLGMAVVHFSYTSPKRLARKEKHYASVPGSGHGIGSLTANIKHGLRDIPPNISWIAPGGWFKRISEAT